MRGLKLGDYIVIGLVVGLILLLFSLTYGFSAPERYIEVIGSDTHEIYNIPGLRYPDDLM